MPQWVSPQHVHEVQLELATANAKFEAQDSISGELRNFMSKTNIKALMAQISHREVNSGSAAGKEEY